MRRARPGARQGEVWRGGAEVDAVAGGPAIAAAGSRVTRQSRGSSRNITRNSRSTYAKAEMRPWRPSARTGDYSDRSTGQNRGIEGGTHSEHEGEVGEAGGGPERRQSTTDAGDVRVEDEVDGECTSRPCSIQCSG